MNNFKIIKASAGSGKTFSLVKEYLKLCLVNKQTAKETYKHILAITFTKAASMDMRRKIVEALDDIIKDPYKSSIGSILHDELKISHEQLQNNAKTLVGCIIHDYSNFCVCTIDSFNQKISRSFAAELGLPHGYTATIDEEEISEILVENIGLELSKDKRLTETLAHYVTSQMEEHEKKVTTRNSIIEYFKKIQDEKAYEKNSRTDCYDEDKYKETINFLKETMGAAEKQIKNYLSRLQEIVSDNNLDNDCFDGKSGGIPKIISKLGSKDLDDIKGIYELKTTQKIINGFVESGENFKWYHKDFSAPKEQLIRIGRQFSEVFNDMATNMPIEKVNKLQIYTAIKKNLYMYVLRSRIEKEIDNIISENEKVSISEFNKRISSILGDYSVPFIYERLGERFKYIFIDEFQDTSILQWHNLIPLIANSLSNGNTCLVVGDGKQAIYHFRNGEVKLLTSLPFIFQKPNDTPAFDEFEQKFKEEHVFDTLKQNWRTAKKIVDFNNNFFRYFINRSDFNKNIKDIYEDENTGNKIEQEFTSKTENTKGLVQIEIVDDREITLDDCTTVSKDDYIMLRIYEIINELKGKYNYKDIAVIAKNNKDCIATANYLSCKNIPVLSSVSLLLRTSKRVMLILNTLAYLLQDDNKVAIAAMLYFKKTLDGAVDNDSIFEPVKRIADHEEAIERYMDLEDGLLKHIQTKSFSLYDLCTTLTRTYGFDTIEDPYINYFINTVQNWQTADNVGIKNFLDFWERKKNELSINIPPDTDAVRIMSIHKAKGLEYPVVIYPFSKGSPVKTQMDNKNNWIDSGKLTERGIQPVPNINKFIFNEKNTLLEDIYNAERDAQDLANINEIYVAMTRPKERLYILSRKYANKRNANVFEEYLAEKDEKKECDKYKLELEESENKYGYKLYRYSDLDPNEEKKAAVLPEIEITDSKTCDWTQKISIDEPDAPLWLQSIAPKTIDPAEWGKIVHLILSEITTPNDIETAIEKNKKIDEETINVLKERINQMITTPTIADAFSDKATIRTEREILTKGSKIKRPDRYAELPDKIILIDYKTGIENQNHTRQLNEYGDAISQLVDKPIEKYIVYIKKNDVTICKA